MYYKLKRPLLPGITLSPLLILCLQLLTLSCSFISVKTHDMRKLLGCLLLGCSFQGMAQTLTVEKIMRDPKWIGSSPTNVAWSYDSKQIYFDWNPLAQATDSAYVVAVNSTSPEKAGYRQARLNNAISQGTYNTTRTQIAYTWNGDIYLLDSKTGRTSRITNTEETESEPAFFGHNEYISYIRNQNLYSWHIATGATRQLTNFVKSSEAAVTPSSPAVMGKGRTSQRDAGSKTTGNPQEQWLQQDELRLMTIVRERKQKREAREAFLKSVKETDTLMTIPIGDQTISDLQISPDGRVITYRLFRAAAGTRNTIVPNYVTESSFTTDIPARTKVGVAQGQYSLYAFDTKRDTVIRFGTESFPGITDQPDYTKVYPAKKDTTSVSRPVIAYGIWWNTSGTAAVVDFRSEDNKDRWLMLLRPGLDTLTVIDRQCDEAWIGGPGIYDDITIGWVNDDIVYFQSEVTGYSHLYTYNIITRQRQALTQGNYEVQQVKLTNLKTHFYLLTNEAHPGKQNWYRIKTDGSNKEQITSMDGGYEINVSPDEKYIAYRYSYINKPWELYIQENAAGKKPVQITHKAASDSFNAYHWRETRIFTIPARDGQPIYTRVYEPAPGKKNGAAVIFVHGAGYLQNVHYKWSSYFREYMFNNLLADKGYTVLDIDYRASSGYGRNWRTGIYRYMGGKDLDDEVDAAQYLVKELGIDPHRIGMYGGSYGGFMTLMALFTQPDVFAAGAALRPVTDWAHYNHGYTSNILNEPYTDSIAYYRSSPINFAAGLKNHLLICHGMVDVNVHFQDAVRLTQRLIELGKDNWELAVFPMEDHGFVEPSSWTDEYKRILKLFDTQLLPSGNSN